MASANVQLVRSIFADWERGEFSSTVWAHPEIEFVISEGPEPTSGKGVSALLEWLSEFGDAHGGPLQPRRAASRSAA